MNYAYQKIEGHVIQQYDPIIGKCLRQSFHITGEIIWEDADGNQIADLEISEDFPCKMVQPDDKGKTK